MHALRVCTLALAYAALVWADAANGDPRLEKLFGSYMAPCCWRQNLLVHQSPKADELRAQIRRAVAAGRSDDDIHRTLLVEYTPRILALPEGTQGQWLQWMPWLGVLLGAGLLALLVKHSLAKGRQQAARPSLGPLPEIEDLI